MGSSIPASPPPSAEFQSAFRERAGAGGTLRFDAFVDLALYHPAVGYYRGARRRVGFGRDTDFYTATSSGAVFGQLVATAAQDLLGGRPPSDFAFVELGTEPGGGVLAHVAHPFRSARTVGLGEDLAIVGPSIVFSNELFDAQPFRRFVFQQGKWHEFFVTLQGDALQATPQPAAPPARFPATAPEGYVIDAPEASVALLDRIAAQPWTGVFIACDYGKSWTELAEHTPEGTARAYSQHRQSNDLLGQPGRQDLTCHVCWDWLQDALAGGGFDGIRLESQESFFIRRAASLIAAITSAEAARFSPKKLSLLQLLHPSHLGQKFEVLHAQRF